MDIFFKSEEHKSSFIAGVQDIGKIYNGKFDAEYAAAIYILTSDRFTWMTASNHVSRYGIDFDAILEEDFSEGFVTLIKLAGNLFNQTQHIDPVEFMRLDEGNFKIAYDAIKLRRYGYTPEIS